MRNNRLFLLFLFSMGILVLVIPESAAAEESSDSTNGVSIQVDRLEGDLKGQSTSPDVSNLFQSKDIEWIETYTAQEQVKKNEEVNNLFTNGIKETTHDTFKKKSLFTAPIKTKHTGESALQQETHALGSASLLENTWFKIILIVVFGASILASYQLYKRDNYER